MFMRPVGGKILLLGAILSLSNRVTQVTEVTFLTHDIFLQGVFLSMNLSYIVKIKCNLRNFCNPNPKTRMKKQLKRRRTPLMICLTALKGHEKTGESKLIVRIVIFFALSLSIASLQIEISGFPNYPNYGILR